MVISFEVECGRDSGRYSGLPHAAKTFDKHQIPRLLQVTDSALKLKPAGMQMPTGGENGYG
jgi:hypothetical protein